MLGPVELHQLSQEIREAVADLDLTHRGYGWLRLLSLLALLITGGVIYWQADQWIIALAGLLLLSLAECGLLIATHDALHGTLLAQPTVEGLLACVISWPMAWPYLTYSVIHLWHHRWNSLDARDPERIPPCSRPWLSRAVFGGGVGLIVSTVHHALELRQDDSRLRWRLLLDCVAIALLHVAILRFVIAEHVLWRYVLSWLFVERLAGAILQTRALVEHWGLWQPRQTHLLSQLYGSCNVDAGRLVNAVLGGLPYHSAHHGFPAIPFHRLPEATARIEAVLSANHLPPLTRYPDYLTALMRLR